MEWFVNDEESLRFIKDITKSRPNHGIFEYEVNLSDDSKLWTCKNDLDDEQILTQSFHNRYPENPQPESMILDRNSRTGKLPARHENE